MLLEPPEQMHLYLITIVKIETGEKYAFIYERGRAVELIWIFMKFAMNRQLSFSWTDAANATKMVRHLVKECN